MVKCEDCGAEINLQTGFLGFQKVGGKKLYYCVECLFAKHAELRLR